MFVPTEPAAASWVEGMKGLQVYKITSFIQYIRARNKQKYSCGWMRRLKSSNRIQMAKKTNSHPYFIEPTSLGNMVRKLSFRPLPGAVRAGVGSDGLGKGSVFSHT